MTSTHDAEFGVFTSALSSLHEIETFLSQHADQLVIAAAADSVELFLGWTPAPNEKLAFSPALVELLAKVGASIVFDVYVE